jgi:hypothetical protein
MLTVNHNNPLLSNARPATDCQHSNRRPSFLWPPRSHPVPLGITPCTLRDYVPFAQSVRAGRDSGTLLMLQHRCVVRIHVGAFHVGYRYGAQTFTGAGPQSPAEEALQGSRRIVQNGNPTTVQPRKGSRTGRHGESVKTSVGYDPPTIDPRPQSHLNVFSATVHCQARQATSPRLT